MVRHTLEGNPPIEVLLRRSARAKRLSLRVSRLDGRVTLTMPPRSSEKEGVAFLRAREDWLRGHLSQVKPVHRVTEAGTVPYEGRMIAVHVRDIRRAALQTVEITVSNARPVGAQVKACLRHQARDRLAQMSDHYAALLGRSYTSLSIRDTRSRWGSCSSKGGLMYSWRLIMAPPEVLDYVAAHEVAHLEQMNHSPAFWAVVDRLFPDYQRCRGWLRDSGDQLHRVSFED